MHDDEENELPCAGKLAFDTRREAQAAATTAAHLHGAKVKVYVCRHCGLWHLSSNYDD